MNTIMTNPSTARSAAATQNWRTAPSPPTPAAATSAVPASSHTGARPRPPRANATAPVTAPIPREAMRRPKPWAPSCNTSRAISGTSTPMLMTNRLMTSKRERTSAISGVSQA